MNVQTSRKLKTKQALSPVLSLPILSAVAELPGAGGIELGLIDGFASIQRALSAVINAVAAGTLDPARARVLLYGLQIASTNARRVASAAKTEETVRDEKKAALEVKPAVTSSATTIIASTLEESQPVLVSQCEQEKPKGEDVEAIANGNESAEAGAKAPTQPATDAAPPAIYSGGVRIPPSCFSPANEYSSGARERLLAARQRARMHSSLELSS
jgi:hypothetical protein